MTTGGKMNKKGFTLIELLIVVAIIGILAMIGIPSYLGQQKRAARTEAYTNLQNLRMLEEQVFAESGGYVAGVDIAALSTSLRGFKPGSDVQYSYKVTTDVGKGLPNTVPVPYANIQQTLSPNTTPCFIATATGTGRRVLGDVFAIDCNNNRNF